MPLRVVDDEAIFLAIGDVHVAVVGIDGDAVDHAEVALAGMVAEPLIDELAVLVEVQDARGADVVGRRLVGVVGALVRVALADIDVAVRREREVQRLPEQPLSLRFVPVAALPLTPIVIRSFPSGLSFITVSPFSSQIQMLSSASMAMPCALFWWPITSSPIVANQLVVLIELEQLRLPGGVALKGEQMPLRIDRDRRDAAAALRAAQTDTRR